MAQRTSVVVPTLALLVPPFLTLTLIGNNTILSADHKQPSEHANSRLVGRPSEQKNFASGVTSGGTTMDE
jgi:hypothetical protein